jgi:DNA polymerase/3'-5' exonuclease PolX
MTANELADAVEGAGDNSFNDQAAYMLRQQAQEIKNCNMDIDALKTFNNDLEQEIYELRKELALQKLSDIGQEIEDRESAIYATGYWNGISKKNERA